MEPTQRQARFAAEFFGNTPRRRATAQELAVADERLQTRFPSDYANYVTRFGSGPTPALRKMADEAGVWPMIRLLSPAESVLVSREGWRGRLPRGVVAIALGEDGDLLCFDRDPSREHASEAALWTYKAATGDLIRAYRSLDDCLEEYLRELHLQD